MSVAVIPSELVASISKAVSQLSVGRTAASVSVGSPSLLIAQGVLKTMMLKKLVVAICAILPLSTIVFGGGLFLVRKSRAQDHKPPTAELIKKTDADPQKVVPKPPEVDPLVQELLKAVRERYESQRAYYEEGRITIDRYVDASKQLELAELRTAQTHGDRLVIMQRHVDRLKEIERREKAELETGRGTVADVSEARERRLQAEVDLKLSQRESSSMDSILRRLGDLERARSKSSRMRTDERRLV